MLSIEAILNTHPFFAPFSPQQRLTMAEHAHMQRVGADEYIFRAGEAAERLYLIGHGCVSLDSVVMEGAPVPVRTLEEGEILGWSWFYPPYVWHFDARALAPTQLLAFDAACVRKLCAADAALQTNITEAMRHIVSNRRTAVAAACQ